MLGKDKKHSCFEYKEARCRTETCENNEIDPRSFCHNICAKPKHVCGETTCEKFVSVEAHGAKKIVCIPRPKCRIKRHFGPTEEDPTESQQTVDNQMRPSKLREKSSIQDGKHDDSANSNKNNKETKGRDAEEVKELMNNIAEKIDAEGIAAIYALAGNDLCPCCECKICQCKLRNVDSQTLHDMRKRALITKRINEEELQKLKGELEDRDDLTEEEKRSFIEELLEEQDEFEYFYEPNLEVFEKERQRKQEKERHEKERLKEKERRKIANQREEEEKEEKSRRKEEEALLMIEALEKEVQAEPETAEHGSQHTEIESEKDISVKISKSSDESLRPRDEAIRSSDQAIRPSDEAITPGNKAIKPRGEVKKSVEVRKLSDEVTKRSDKVQEDKSEGSTALIDSKTSEWAGVKPQVQPTLIDKSVKDAKEKTSLISEGPSVGSTTDRVSDASQFSNKFKPTPTPPPSISNQPGTGQPQLDLQQIHAFDQSWLDENEKMSVSKMIMPEISKTESDNSSKHAVDLMPMKPLKKKKPTTTMELVGSFISVDSKVSALSDATAASALSTRKEEKVESTPEKVYEFDFEKFNPQLDVCKCLPGYCTCAEQHYTFKRNTETEDFGMGFKQLLVDKMISAKKEGEKTSGSSGNSSCSCIHTEEEIKVTPVTSRIEVVPPSSPYIKPELKKSRSRGFVRCVRPKYQKTLVIVKPEAVHFKDVIISAIKREGLEILQERFIQLTPEQVAEIYSENFGSAYFPMFVQQMSSSPILVVAIAGKNAVERWNTVVGPEKKIPLSWFYPASMRRRFSIHKDVHDVMKLSEDFQKAKTEIRYFFPLNIIDPLMISSVMVQDYCDKFIHPILLKGLHQVVLRKPLDPIGFLAEWLLIYNPFQPFYNKIQVSLSPT